MVGTARYFWHLSAAVVIAGLMMFGQPANAAVVGQAVATFGADPSGGTVGTLSTALDASGLGTGAIKYFIPLSTNSGTYGVTNSGAFGTVSDNGIGGGVLAMNLSFLGVSTTQSSVLNIFFEDLDLIGVNDPTGFLETVQLFDNNGPITSKIIDLSSSLVSTSGVSPNEMVTLSLNLGVLSDALFGVQLRFDSSYAPGGDNTPEYLRAEVSAVPLPPALPLFLTALLGLGLYRRRRQRKMMALQHA